MNLLLSKMRLFFGLSLIALCHALGAGERDLPNFIVILADDQGYSDIGCYGAEGFETPHLDRMAEEGMRFTNFYASAAICSPTRAALLTGCYPPRVGITTVTRKDGSMGINPDEVLLPELLKAKAYQTALFGKWHLGNSERFMPLQNGFDEFLGTPHSNDSGNVMSPQARKLGFTELPLYEGNERIEVNPDQGELTKWYTHASIDFIRRNQDRPFFLHLAYNMPHTPIFASDDFRGKSERGLYGDVIMEIDWSVGQILKALKDYGVDENTLVVFTSDNGPWLIFGEHGGSADPFRGGKKQTLEGGMRVPFIARWPGRIPSGKTNDELVTMMDLLPTFARLSGSDLPSNRIDGKDIWPLLAGELDARSPHQSFSYYFKEELRAIRRGQWKLQLPHLDTLHPDYENIATHGYRSGVVSVKNGQALYDLENDPSEERDLSGEFPLIVSELQVLAQAARDDLGDSILGIKGKGNRQAGSLRKGK